MKPRIRCRFPKQETINHLENVFVCNLETYNGQEFAEAYASGLYKVNRLRVRRDGDLTIDELVIRKDIFTVFDGSNGNPVRNMLKNNSEKYESDERTYIDKDGDEIVSSYRLLLVAHSSVGLDSWVVLISLVKEIAELKFIKTARG